MKKYCLLLSVMLLCFLCACSVTGQNERTTMYDIMESGTDEEIAAAAKDAQEKHDELFQLAMDESSAWYAYVDDNSTENALKAAQDAMVDFFVSEGFSADDFLEVWKNCTMFYPPRGKVFRMSTSLSTHTIPAY